MNPENLKMIVDLISQLGLQGKEVFIWYLVLTDGLHFLEVVMGLSIIAYAVLRIVKVINQNEYAAYCVSIREFLQVGTRGYYSSDDHEEVIRKLAAMQQNEKEKP